MANLITEGFDWMASGLATATRERLFGASGWYPLITGTTVPDVTTGRFDFGKALRLAGASGSGVNQHYIIPLGGDKSEVYFGVACFITDDLSVTSGGSITLFDAVNGKGQLRITLDKFGVIRVWRGPTNLLDPFGTRTLLASSRMGAYQENEWFFLEAHPIIAASGGGIEIRVNTVPVLQLTGANTQGSTIATADSIAIGWLSSGAPGQWDVAYDDFYLNDTAGAANNSWLGNVRVKTQLMTANGATDNFSIGGTSPAATNWQSVLNNLLDDSKFVYSPNVGDIDLYTPDPNLNAPLVRVVQVRMGLRQDDATQRVARGLLRIGGVNYESAVDHYTNQTFTFYRSKWDLNPATGVSFTGTEVNGLQAGVKVQA